MGSISVPAVRVRSMLTGLLALVLFAVIAERAAYAGLYRGDATLESLGRQLVLMVPALIYVTALWQFRALAGTVATGSAFAPAAAKYLRWAGRLLLIGAAGALLTAPSTRRLIDLDVSTLVIAAVGCALALVARLLDQGREIQDELDQIF